jgi:four helix bundle protein
MMNDEQRDSRLDLRSRTKKWALRIIQLYSSLPKTTQAQVLGRQALRSGTSVGAHYRAATRARSNPEFVSKIECGLQELDETVYWLELLVEAGILKQPTVQELLREAEELTAIFVASAKTAKRSSGR